MAAVGVWFSLVSDDADKMLHDRSGNRYTRSVFAWFADVFLAILVFGATNIDDILLLALFFADGRFRSATVFTGQFVGIGLLTAVSAAAAFLALSIPAGWVALLGLLPLVLGVRGLYALWHLPRLTKSGDQVDLDLEKPAPQANHSQWISVAFVTVANGGDNLGVYIPLFSQDFSSVPIYVAVFAVMTAVWCGAGYWLVSHPLLGPRIRSCGHIALPFVLTGLGALILSDAKVLFGR